MNDNLFSRLFANIIDAASPERLAPIITIGFDSFAIVGASIIIRLKDSLLSHELKFYHSSYIVSIIAMK